MAQDHDHDHDHDEDDERDVPPPADREAVTEALQAAIDRLDNRLSVLDSKIDDDRERIAIVEQSAKQAHKRIDRLDKVVDSNDAN